MMTPATVSVLIPARNAQATLSQTLDSLLAQLHRDWEAIIVDDRSRDGTAEIARRYVERDGRFRLIAGEGLGAAAARNQALAHAGGRWLLFLDSDDWIAPELMTRMLAALAAKPDATVCCCGYQRVTPSGDLLPPRFDAEVAERPMHVFARSAALAIHAFVIDRELVVRSGGFDSTLRTCEDWDLWQRIAATGARFVVVPEVLSFYRMSGSSLTRDPAAMIADAHTVIRRGFAALDPAPDAHRAAENEALFFFMLWVATQSAGAGTPGAHLLLPAPEVRHLQDQLDYVVATLVDALAVGARCTPAQLAGHWPHFGAELSRVLDVLAARAATPGLKRRIQAALDRYVIAHASLDRPAVLGTTLALRSDIAKPVEIVPPPSVDTLYLQLCTGKTILSTIEMPIVGGIDPAELRALAIEALGARRYWKALARADWKGLRIARTRKSQSRNHTRQTRLIEQARSAARAVAPTRAAKPAIHADREAAATPADRRSYWEEVFAKPDPWNYGSAYEQEKYRYTYSLLPPGRIGSALELACAEGWFTISLAERADALIASDISSAALERARQRCGNCDNVSYQQLDLAADPLPSDLDLIICSEVLYYLREEDELHTVAHKIAAALAPGGRLLTAHANIVNDDPSRTAFDWDHPFGAAVISRAFADAPELILERSLRTEIYQIDLFRRLRPGELPDRPLVETRPIEAALDTPVARQIVWGGTVMRRSDAIARETATTIPVLMYHRVSDEPGPPELERYRVTPAAFREQMHWLRRHGYYSISPRDVAAHLKQWRPFWGRPVLITFDDGTADFAETAWPILRDNDFSAINFIVTGHVGGSAVWDADYGPPTRLMTWEQIGALSAEGAHFGSHLASHTAIDGLDTAALIDELAGSAELLGAYLGTHIESFAAPYGVTDSRLLRLLWPCGYWLAFTTEGGIAKLGDAPYSLPRVEIAGNMDLSAFARALGRRDERKELVSVIIPAYNAALTIDETLRSVRSQTHDELEILVIDDGSSDDTPALVERHASSDKRIKLLKKQNGGVAAARNFGIEHARADLIAFVDADDLWAASKIEKQVRALRDAGERAGLAYTWFAVIDEHGRILDANTRPTESGNVLERMCFGNLVGNGSSVLVTRAALRAVGGFDPSLRARKAQGCEDLQFYFRMSESYEFVLVPEFLTGYRRVPGNMSDDLMQMLRSRLLVSELMISRQPRHESTVRRGDVEFIVWLLACAIERGRLPEIAQLSAHVLSRDPSAFASVVDGNLRRLRRRLRRLRDEVSLGAFAIGDPVAV